MSASELRPEVQFFPKPAKMDKVCREHDDNSLQRLRNLVKYSILAEANAYGCLVSIGTDFFSEFVVTKVARELTECGYEVSVDRDMLYVSW